MNESLLQKRIEVLEKALEFYAKKENYESKYIGKGKSMGGEFFDMYEQQKANPSLAIEALKTSRYLRENV